MLKIIQINRLSCESQIKLGQEPGQDLSPYGVLRRENASEKINTYLSPYEKQKVCVCVCEHTEIPLAVNFTINYYSSTMDIVVQLIDKPPY